jgi:hypothetical protein
MSHQTSQEELNQRIRSAMDKVKIGSKYFHYKSPEKLYTIIDIVMIEETEEPGVVYKPDYVDSPIKWLRPISNFLSEVEVGGEKVMRFTLI